VTVSGTYTLPLDKSIGEISFGATFTHTDKTPAVSQAISPNFYVLKASNLLDLNANWRNIAGRPIDLTFFMTNVTNEERVLFPGGAYGTIGADGGHLNQPRMWGFRLRYSFGN
jgi:iron complex outermembrane receptor protein